MTTSIEMLTSHQGTRHENEATAILLTRVQKHLTEARAVEVVGYWIEDLMRGKITPPRSSK